MKPQEQDKEAKIESHVYVQKPDGEEMDIKKMQAPSEESPEQAMQTAENTPNKSWVMP